MAANCEILTEREKSNIKGHKCDVRIIETLIARIELCKQQVKDRELPCYIEYMVKDRELPCYIECDLGEYHLIGFEEYVEEKRYAHSGKKTSVAKVFFVTFLHEDWDHGKQFPNFHVAFFADGSLMEDSDPKITDNFLMNEMLPLLPVVTVKPAKSNEASLA